MRFKYTYFTFRLLLVLFILHNQQVSSQIFNPVADSYIHDVNASTNYGSAVDLIVKKGNATNFRKGFVKFDLTTSGISTVSGAVVRLYATSSIAVGMNVHQASDTWTETGITWNNAPTEGTVISSVDLIASQGYYEWDVTPYVQAQLAAGDKVISLVFYSVSYTQNAVTFKSKEASANKPELEISTSSVVPAAPTDLVASAVSSGQINLTWTDHADNESGFRIEHKSGTGSFTEIATTGSNVTVFNNTGLTPATAYTYRVVAFNLSGNSIYSNEAAATTQNLVLTSYYVDNIYGNDAYNGLSPATAWKTLTKVNSVTFTAGNQLLFKAGGVWTGRLYPKGSGLQGSPVIIDMYGTGNKPLIDGNGMTGTGVFYLYNQQYWEINNLEITNNAVNEGDRRGVRIEADNFGTANHIYLKNLFVHDIKGSIGQNRSDKRTGGIGFAVVDASAQETHFNDLLIENCVISSCSNQGIITECVAEDGFDPYSPEWNAIKITNAVIRNNIISNISKNAMIVRLFENGLVENNLCYNTANGISGNTIFSAACYGTVFQYNEGYDNHSPDADGSMYDPDLRSPNTIWQYSYSHNNAHGLFWSCTVQLDANVVCRYNISQNDKGNIFCINYPVTSLHIYNNTVYIPANLSPQILSERNVNNGSRTYVFNNNIIYNLSPTATYDFTASYNRTIDYNCFYGIHPATEPADPHKITADPKLVNPGSAGIGLNTTDGYKLQSGSSCINTGKTISNNGGKDYWGNILYNGTPDVGAHEYTLPPSAPTNLTATAVSASQINLFWTDNSSNETGFRIERKENTGSYTLLATVNTNTNTYSNTGLVSGITYTYRVLAANASGNSAYSNEAAASVSKTLNLKVFIQGLYDGPAMRKAQDENGNKFTGSTADKINIKLNNGSNYNTLVYSCINQDIDTSGNVSVNTIPLACNDNYYITIEHRNSIRIVSATPVSFSAGIINYDFTTSASKAYGNNQLQLSSGTFGMFGGDVNADGSVDALDLIGIDNDANSFSTGYLNTDCNGDGAVDAFDLILCDNNVSGFISAITP